MAIPKVIYQTFKSNDIPWLTRFYIKLFLRKNKGYRYEFYDDARTDELVRTSFDARIYHAHARLQVGAAEADSFRYAISLKNGGIYLDMDRDILASLDKPRLESDTAVTTRATNPQQLFAQWAL